jgi:ATP-binding cassette subfamily B multidrug efflux pump
VSADATAEPASGESIRPDRGLLRWLLLWARPYRARVLSSAALVLGGSLLQVAGPLITAAAIDLYLKPAPSASSRFVAAVLAMVGLPVEGSAGLITLVLVYLVTLFASAGLLSLQAQVMLITGQLVMRDLRDALFAHIQKLEVAWFSRTPAGRIITRLTSDVEALNEVFTSGLVDILADVLVLFGVAGVLFALDVRLALIAFAVLPLLLILSVWFRKRARSIYHEVRTRLAAINTHLQEHLAGMSVVQLARAEARTAAAFTTLDADHRDVNIRGIFYYAIFYPAVELLTTAGLAAILVLGGFLSLRGALSLGVLVAFLQYVQRFYRPISDLAENYNVMQASFAAAERLRTLLETLPQVPEPRAPAPAPPRNGEIAFDDVTFAYENDLWVLRDISFRAAPGERIAIVGHTGAGKSTLVNLVLRFYDPQHGAVLVDGLDTRQWSLLGLRRRFAVVLQEIDCFAGTLRDNIRLGRTDIDDDRISWSLQQVGAQILVERLPNGLSTVLGERGAGLSQGERQLVSFARALVGDPEFLLLDEATSSVDAETETVIQRALLRLLRGRTSLIIAHRLATVLDCDRVLVFHHGHLAEQGSHSELLARGGLYRTLYELQLLRQGPAGAVPQVNSLPV